MLQVSDSMPQNIKSIFIWSGSLSCFLLVVFLGILLYGLAVQKEWVEAATLFGLDMNGSLVFMLIGCYGLIVVFGWVTIYAGRKLPCSECGEPILTKDRFGFRGLACKPVRMIIQGRQLCSNCLEKSG